MYFKMLLYSLILFITILGLLKIITYSRKKKIRESFFMDFGSSLSSFQNQDTSSSSFINDFLGPDYNYIKKIKTPKKLKVSADPNLFALPPDFKAVQHYIKTLVKGNPPLGNSFFIKSGTCNKENSVPECQGQDRWIYINNKSTGLVPCTTYKSSNKGLIPGLIEDSAEINPYEIFKSLAGIGPNYSTNCFLRTEKTGSGKKRKKETKCSVPTLPVECLPSF